MPKLWKYSVLTERFHLTGNRDKTAHCALVFYWCVKLGKLL